MDAEAPVFRSMPMPMPDDALSSCAGLHSLGELYGDDHDAQSKAREIVEHIKVPAGASCSALPLDAALRT